MFVKRVLVAALLLACVLCHTATAAPSSVRPTAGYATGSLQQSVYGLPEYGGKLYLTVVGSESDSGYRNLCATFAKNPEMAQLKESFLFHELATERSMYRDRYAQSKDFSGDFPKVILNSMDGGIVWERSGDSIPQGNDLIVALKAECLRRRPTPVTPPLDVKPAPAPTPVAPAPRKPNYPAWQIVVCGLAAGVVLAFCNEWSLTSAR